MTSIARKVRVSHIVDRPEGMSSVSARSDKTTSDGYSGPDVDVSIHNIPTEEAHKLKPGELYEVVIYTTPIVVAPGDGDMQTAPPLISPLK